MPDQLNNFFTVLKGALRELQRVYDDLLVELEETLYKSFGFSDLGNRERLAARASELSVF